MVPLKQLKQIADAYAVNVIDAVNKADKGRLTAQQAAEELTRAQKVVAEAWKAYMATTLTVEEARLAQEAQRLFAAAERDIAQAKQALAGLSGNAAGQLG